eukprot:24786-Chlamydomonas_euryale.AAC.1
MFDSQCHLHARAVLLCPSAPAAAPRHPVTGAPSWPSQTAPAAAGASAAAYSGEPQKMYIDGIKGNVALWTVGNGTFQECDLALAKGRGKDLQD